MYRSNIYWKLRRDYYSRIIARNVTPVVLVGLVCWAAYMFILIINFPAVLTVITLN